MANILVLILAKSYKPGGRCIAGKKVEYNTATNTVIVGNWVRPVSNDGTGHGTLTREMYTYSDNTEVNILDIVEIPILRSSPIAGQPENFIIDQSVTWKKVTTFSPTHVQKLVDQTNSIWLEDGVSTDIVTSSYDENGLITQSLYLIKPTNLMLTLSLDYNDYEGKYKRKIVAQFDYDGVRYENLSVTCPSTRRVLTNQYPEEGGGPVTMPLRKGDDYNLCISLSPRFGEQNHHYKLIATVFDFDGYLQRTYTV